MADDVAQWVNLSTYKPSVKTTIDGRECLDDSEEWRCYCEALTNLRRPMEGRKEHFEKIAKFRGVAGLQILEAEMSRIEPHFILGMPNRDVRRAYLRQVEYHRGPVVRERLERRIVEAWEAQKLAADKSTAA